MNALLWCAQIALAVLQIVNFLSAILLLLMGRARNAILAGAHSVAGLVLGLGAVVPWLTGQAMILTPVAASLLVLLVLRDGLTMQGAAPAPVRAGLKGLLEHHEARRFLSFDALYLSIVLVLAVAVAVGRFRAFGAWGNSPLYGWLPVGFGTMMLVLSLLRAPMGPSKNRLLHAGLGLLLILLGCLTMLREG